MIIARQGNERQRNQKHPGRIPFPHSRAVHSSAIHSLRPHVFALTPMPLLTPEPFRRLEQFQLLAVRPAFVPKGQPEISQPQRGWFMFPQPNPSRRDGGNRCAITNGMFQRPSGTENVFVATFQPRCGWLMPTQPNPSWRDGGNHSAITDGTFHRPSGTENAFVAMFQPLRGRLISVVAPRLCIASSTRCLPPI